LACPVTAGFAVLDVGDEIKFNATPDAAFEAQGLGVHEPKQPDWESTNVSNESQSLNKIRLKHHSCPTQQSSAIRSSLLRAMQ
jgi:hypothetical protein